MQSVNVLIVGNGQTVEIFKQSKFLNKLYITSETEIPGTLRIMFNTFKELAKKCKALQIDFVIVEDEKWVLQGIANVMKQNHINCFGATAQWTNLKLSHNYAKNMLEKYNILFPPQITLPVEFPVLVKGDGLIKKAYSMQEIIDIKEDAYNSSPEIAKTIFIEKYLPEKKYKLYSLFDGKNLLTFPQDYFDEKLINDYTEALKTVLLNENAEFMGFINSELIQHEGKLYNTGFSFEFPQLNINKDIIYILLSAMYQKLNELELSEM